MRMGSRVQSARFDEEGRRWRLQLEGGEGISTHFLLPALGFASKPYIPDMRGIAAFEGDWCHTARWPQQRSEEHTSELQSLMRTSYAVFCLKKKTNTIITILHITY